MEKFIAMCLCLPLILVFVMQYGLQVTNNYALSQGEVIIAAAKETAKQDGEFTTENKNKIIESFEELGISRDDITIKTSSGKKYRSVGYSRENNIIEYSINVDFGKAIAGGSFFGLNEDNNRLVKTYSGEIASEALR